MYSIIGKITLHPQNVQSWTMHWCEYGGNLRHILVFAVSWKEEDKNCLRLICSYKEKSCWLKARFLVFPYQNMWRERKKITRGKIFIHTEHMYKCTYIFWLVKDVACWKYVSWVVSFPLSIQRGKPNFPNQLWKNKDWYVSVYICWHSQKYCLLKTYIGQNSRQTIKHEKHELEPNIKHWLVSIITRYITIILVFFPLAA